MINVQLQKIYRHMAVKTKMKNEPIIFSFNPVLSEEGAGCVYSWEIFIFIEVGSHDFIKDKCKHMLLHFALLAAFYGKHNKQWNTTF